jgi:hypothetical protein
MSEHEGHEARADEVERELDEMEERSDRLHDEIESTGEDWQRKKRDESIPGATGEDPTEDAGEDGGDGEAAGDRAGDSER